MQTILYVTFLKPGMLDTYIKFSEEITGPRKKEYKELLLRYGHKSAKVWHKKISGKDLIIILHKSEDDALEKMKNWASSTHPFDHWFGEKLEMCYEEFPDPSKMLFSFDTES